MRDELYRVRLASGSDKGGGGSGSDNSGGYDMDEWLDGLPF